MTAPSASGFVEALRFGPAGLRPGQHEELVQGVVLAWHLGWSQDALRDYLTDGVEWFDRQPGGRAAEYARRLDPDRLPRLWQRVDDRPHCRVHRNVVEPCVMCVGAALAAAEPPEPDAGGPAAARGALKAVLAARGTRVDRAPARPHVRAGARPVDVLAPPSRPQVKPAPVMRAVDPGEEAERRRQLDALAALGAADREAS